MRQSVVFLVSKNVFLPISISKAIAIFIKVLGNIYDDIKSKTYISFSKGKAKNSLLFCSHIYTHAIYILLKL